MSVDFKFSDVIFRQFRQLFPSIEFQTLFRVVGMLVAYVLAPKSEPSSTSGSSRKQI
ncbi:unnamed protein product [Prunus armeniaca]